MSNAVRTRSAGGTTARAYQVGRGSGASRSRTAVRALVALSLLSTVVLLLDVGPVRADGPTGFTNAANINIPGSGDGVPAGAPASTYPSTATVSGLTGLTSKVTVTFTDLSHSSLSDMRALLVSPTGQSLTLMSNVGGGGSLVDITDQNITFDDAAGTNLPGSGSVVTGSYKPTDDNPGAESFPAPAPVPSAATALSTFNGANPNGAWSLYITDNVSGDTGNMGGGWTITVTTAVAGTPGTLQFSSATYAAGEGDGTATITIDRTGGSTGAVSVQFQTLGTGTAVEGSQYSALTQTVNFGDGVTSQTVDVTVLDNAVVEGANRTVDLALNTVGGGATLGLSSAVLSIGDNDSTENATPITIPASGSGSPTGAAAAPYPSNIVISGQIGTVADVDVNIIGLTHSFPQDISMLLVGPAGQNIELLSGTGDGSGAVGASITFDDAAGSAITSADPVVTGSFQPSAELGGPDPYPLPAPAVSGATVLSTFNGTDPNGTWSLYIIDGAFGDTGTLAGGWSLTISTAMSQNVNEGDAVTIDWSGAGSQPAGHPLTAVLNQTGGQAPLFIQSTATAFKFIAPRTPTAAGETLTFDLEITDTVTTGTTTVPVTINSANIVPIASATANSPAVAGQAITLVGGSIDPIEMDISPIVGFGRQYTWSQTGGTAVTLNPVTNFRNRSFTPPSAGTYTFSLTVVDHGGTGAASAPAPVTVEVRDAAGAGTLSGIVRDTSAALVADVTVDVLATATGAPIATTTTSASGAWSVGGLSNGTAYFVRFTKAGFGTRWANDGLTIGGAGVRPVLAPSPLVDAVLTPTASLRTIDGNAVNSSNAAVAALAVRLFDTNGLVATTLTNGVGHYQFSGLTPKTKYRIQLGSGNGTFNIAWVTIDGRGAILGSTGSPSLFFSTVAGNLVVPTITMFNKTTEARSIQATLTADGSGLSGAQMRVYDANGFVQSQLSNAGGVYTISNLRPGATYKVWIWTKCPGCPAADLASEWFDDVPGEQFDQSGKLATVIDLTVSNANLAFDIGF